MIDAQISTALEDESSDAIKGAAFLFNRILFDARVDRTGQRVFFFFLQVMDNGADDRSVSCDNH